MISGVLGKGPAGTAVPARLPDVTGHEPSTSALSARRSGSPFSPEPVLMPFPRSATRIKHGLQRHGGRLGQRA